MTEGLEVGMTGGLEARMTEGSESVGAFRIAWGRVSRDLSAHATFGNLGVRLTNFSRRA